LFTKNLYQRYLVRDREDRHYLSASRLISLVIVAGGLVLTFAFGSVAELLQFFWKVTGLVGICFWAGVLWRRANRWGAWASIAVSGAVLILASDMSLADQIAWYLSCGILAMIVVSLLTPPESKTMLDRFYTILHTPVGQEQRLRDAGIKVVLE
jgi:Na+/proline symporter